MKKGKHLGEFSFKTITYRILPKARVEVNIEGTATGFSGIFGTVSFQRTPEDMRGTYHYDWVAVSEKGGDMYGSNESGTWEVLGDQRWRTTGLIRFSNGTAVIEEGEIDRAERTWTGRFYEAI